MRILLLLPLAVLLAGCGRYGSSKEANAACQKWAELGGEYWVDWGTPENSRYAALRRCELEKETSQWLGTVAPFAKGARVNSGQWLDGLDRTTVEKRFSF